jgi:hypothetical protein
MFSLERVWRGVLALVIVGTIPLSMWGSGCSSQPLVQPDAGQTGGAPGTGGISSGGQSGGSGGAGGSLPRDASTDGASLCCSAAESNVVYCLPGGKTARYCGSRIAEADNNQCGTPGSYDYVWEVLSCPNGCVADGGGTTGPFTICR